MPARSSICFVGVDCFGECDRPYRRLRRGKLHFNGSSWKTTIQVVALGSEQLQQAQVLCGVAGLHLGEAQAIVLAQSSGDTVLLTDDAAARLYASRLGMEVRGSLGLVLASVAKEKITYDQGLHFLQRLRQSSLWLSGKVFEEAVDALREIAGRV